MDSDAFSEEMVIHTRRAPGVMHKYNKKKIMCDKNAPAASELVDGQVVASSSTSRQKPDGPLAADHKIFEGSADSSPAESACDAR